MIKCDDELMEALKYCASDEECINCPVNKFCDEHSLEMVKKTFEFVSRLKRENENLKNLKSFEKFINDKIHNVGTDYQCDYMTPEAKAEAFERELAKLYDVAEVHTETIKQCLETINAEIVSSDKFIEEYDDSEVQKSYNAGLRDAYKVVKGMQIECNN